MLRCGKSSGCAIGAYVNGMENLNSFQSAIGKKLAVVLWYIHWPEPFPRAEADAVYANGSMPLITWEPWVKDGLAEIVSGKHDGYIREFIQAAKDCGRPILLRFAHEMNGNWYPWDGFHNGANPAAAERYKRVWLSIYNVRQELQADNIKLVWCPNHADLPAADWNKLTAYYPGDQYVDWVGMDGYNWGYGKWETFDLIFGQAYKELTRLTDKPLMIGEFGSAESGGSKAEWIKDAFLNLKKDYQRVKLLCWFNINKERDWRVDSSPSAVAAFRDEIADSFFVENLI
ncbi:glycoside hydrolase family 26 protein [Candidatus Margulisiibacteriota bacterium]